MLIFFAAVVLRKVAVRPGCIVSMSDFSGPCYKVRIDIYNDRD